MTRRLLLSIAGVLLAFLLAAPHGAAASDTDPITYTPIVTPADDRGECRKGTSQCRWGGDCVEREDRCYNCRKGQQFSHRLGCYECPPNRTPHEVGDDIVCKSNLRR